MGNEIRHYFGRIAFSKFVPHPTWEFDGPRRYGVDGDARVSEFHGQSLGECNQRRLGSHVGERRSVLPTPDGRHIDDTSPLLPFHVRQGESGEPNTGEQDQLERERPRRIVGGIKIIPDCVARIVHQDVYRTQRSQRFLDYTTSPHLARNVGLNAECFDAECPQILDCLIERFSASGADGYVAPLPGQGQRRVTAQTPTAPR